MAKTIVNNNIKLKSGGGVINDATDGLSVSGILPATVDGSLVINLYQSLSNFVAFASDSLVTSNDTSVAIPNNQTVYTKAKEIVLNDCGGTIRVKFDLKGDTSNSKSYGARIYKNGVAFGTEQTAIDNTTKSEDLVFASGDLIQIYTKVINTNGNAGALSNFRLYYSKGASPVTNTVNL